MGSEPSSALLSGSSNHPEPPPSQSARLDKYKALFDASNPDRAPSDTQTETGVTPVHTVMLSAVPEEQESQGQSQRGDARGTKRNRADDDVEMADGSAETGENRDSQTRLPKRRAVGANAVQQSVPVTQRKPNSASQYSGAVEGAAAATGINRAAKLPSSAKSSMNKLDTDENFLKAVNSMKRGKKHEDDFDREFNQLRITNPKAKKKQDRDQDPIAPEDAVGTATTSDAAATSRPWEAIDDFGDVGLRGNFMVVVEMEVHRGSAKPTLSTRNKDDANSEWVGKPNFKKFKKVQIAAFPFFWTKVELTRSDVEIRCVDRA